MSSSRVTDISRELDKIEKEMQALRTSKMPYKITLDTYDREKELIIKEIRYRGIVNG